MYYIILYSIILYYIVLYSIIFYYILLYCIILFSSVSHVYGLLDDNFIEHFGDDFCTTLKTFQGQISCNGDKQTTSNGKL